ncbi:subtilisin-like protease SBT4.8 [Brassica napus]|nr:subtilisin-like protease SBT4.8 [Brassica napus]
MHLIMHVHPIKNLQITSSYKKMEKLPANSFCVLSCVLVLFLSSVSAVTDDPQDKQVYIVYMGSLPSGLEYRPMSHHMSILQEITGESSIEGRLVRSYKRSFNGFAARLSEPERQRIAEMEGVVSVFRSKKLQIQTTASWDFMGLKEGNKTKRNPAVESDTIIGVFDTGIWPESESFSDKGFGPPPKKWKGVCSGGKNFTCNNKLIGARDYEGEGARDVDGHGSHTSSIAAGNAVAGASFFGIGNGTARGGVPAARIAAYKICDSTGCKTDAILSAFDDAIADGVDIISISIGGVAIRYEEDTTAIGAFHVMAKGILTVNSAGNDGPKPTSVGSVAPWMLTVGASTTNREFLTKVVLQNGKTLSGRSVNTFDLKGKNYPLVYERSKVKGEILVSRETVSSETAVATIIEDDINVAIVSARPLSALSPDDFNFLVSYVNSTKSTQGTVLKTEAVFNQEAPKIASFSSRGPNTIAVDLLKPDITAPGVEILAAFSPLGSPSEDEVLDPRHVKYSVISGTSMSCPHVAGVAAYIKTFHLDWSPAAIQSAIMTTAWSMNASDTGVASTDFAYGAGHVDPIAALNPGLVYDLDKADHVTFLCGLNYTSESLKLISGETVTCTGNTLPRNLNYPSMSAKLSETNSSFTITFNRTVTNVGTPNSTYISKIILNHGTKLSVKVSPSVLAMKTVKEKQSFTVTVSGSSIDPQLPSSASLIWSDGTHKVRSPIVVYTDVAND